MGVPKFADRSFLQKVTNEATLIGGQYQEVGSVLSSWAARNYFRLDYGIWRVITHVFPDWGPTIEAHWVRLREYLGSWLAENEVKALQRQIVLLTRPLGSQDPRVEPLIAELRREIESLQERVRRAEDARFTQIHLSNPQPFDEMLRSNTELLDTLKTQVLDLCLRCPDAPGTASLGPLLDRIQNNWLTILALRQQELAQGNQLRISGREEI